MGRLVSSTAFRTLASPLVFAVITLATLGLVNLRAMRSPDVIGALFGSQLCWLGLSVLAGAVVVLIDLRTIERQAYRLYALGAVLLVAVLVLGPSINGARRWLDFAVIHLQPSELMKLALIVAIARYVADNPRGGEALGLRDLLVPAVMTAVPTALILWQPDLSSAMLLALIASALMIVAGLRLRALAALLGLGLLTLPAVWAWLLHGYQRARVLTFLSQGADPLGAGWQTRQSIIAIGSGGLGGKGLGGSTQLTFVPCHHTDLPFSIFSEERGLAGALLVLALYLVICLWCVRTSRVARNRFGAMVAAGVAIWVFFQVFINIGVAMGVVPPTGVALPFFSTGGSAVFSLMLGLGLVISVGIRREARE